MKMPNKMPIKMIGLDLDGTLLTDEKKLTPYTREVIIKALEYGIVVLPATGRPLTGIPDEILNLPGLRYALTANGARIVDIKENKVIYESLLTGETAGRILDVLEQYDTLREVIYDGTGYTNAAMKERVYEYLGVSPMAAYVLKTRTPVADIRELTKTAGQSIDKVQAVFKYKEEQILAHKALAAMSGIEVTSTIDNNLEVTQSGADKGNGLLRLGELLGIQKEEIMAVGDGMNDLHMIEKAGFGVAMYNAGEEVKSAADYVTESNEQEGVAKAIIKVVIMQEETKRC